jgi:hypothetical protein
MTPPRECIALMPSRHCQLTSLTLLFYLCVLFTLGGCNGGSDENGKDKNIDSKNPAVVSRNKSPSSSAATAAKDEKRNAGPKQHISASENRVARAREGYHPPGKQARTQVGATQAAASRTAGRTEAAPTTEGEGMPKREAETTSPAEDETYLRAQADVARGSQQAQRTQQTRPQSEAFQRPILEAPPTGHVSGAGTRLWAQAPSGHLSGLTIAKSPRTDEPPSSTAAVKEQSQKESSSSSSVVNRASELDELTVANSTASKGVDSRAQEGIQLASIKPNESDQHAVDDENKAQTAQQLATQANNRLTTIEQMVANISLYKPTVQTEIRFRPGQLNLSKRDEQALDQTVGPLKEKPEFIIEIQGFSSGDGEKGSADSQQMADSVVRYLVLNHDIPFYRIYVVGAPNAPSQTTTAKEGKERTSGGRVEVSILAMNP